MQIGDIVGFVFSQLADDVTYMVIESIDHEIGKATCWDILFDFRVADVDVSKLWKAADRELQQIVGMYGRSVTVQELALRYDEAVSISRSPA